MGDIFIWPCSRSNTTFFKIQVGYRHVIFQFVFQRFLSSDLTWASLKFWGDVINMSRAFFSTLVGMGSRSHDFDDELEKSFLISSFIAWSKTLILGLISVFCTVGIFCTLSGNLERIILFFNFIHKIIREMVTKWCYLELCKSCFFKTLYTVLEMVCVINTSIIIRI